MRILNRATLRRVWLLLPMLGCEPSLLTVTVAPQGTEGIYVVRAHNVGLNECRLRHWHPPMTDPPDVLASDEVASWYIWLEKSDDSEPLRFGCEGKRPVEVDRPVALTSFLPL